MRIRSIKPEFWRSDDIAALPISARLLFVGLWSYVDDNGVGSDKLASIAADLFAPDLAVDPTETFRRVSVDTTRLQEQGLIVRYQAAGKPLLFITNWERHQLVKNPSKGNLYPLPPGEKVAEANALRRPSVDPPETLGTGTGEQGNRGTGEQGKKPTYVLEESSVCNVREKITPQQIDELQGMFYDLTATDVSSMETLVAVELITEPASDLIDDVIAYVRAAIEQSEVRVIGLVGEATRQVKRMRTAQP